MRYSAFFSLLLLAGPAAVVASPVAFSIPGANDILSKTKDIVQSGGDAIKHAENLVPKARGLEHEEEKRQTSSGSSGTSSSSGGAEGLFDEIGDAASEYIASKGGLAGALTGSSSSSSGLSQIPGAKKLSKFMGGSSSDDSNSDSKKNKNKNKDDDDN